MTGLCKCSQQLLNSARSSEGKPGAPHSGSLTSPPAGACFPTGSPLSQGGQCCLVELAAPVKMTECFTDVIITFWSCFADFGLSQPVWHYWFGSGLVRVKHLGSRRGIRLLGSQEVGAPVLDAFQFSAEQSYETV